MTVYALNDLAHLEQRHMDPDQIVHGVWIRHRGHCRISFWNGVKGKGAPHRV